MPDRYLYRPLLGISTPDRRLVSRELALDERITPEMLEDDYNGENARLYRVRRLHHREQMGNLLAYGCSDSRKSFPDYVDIHRSIGNTTIPETLRDPVLMKNQGFIILSHFDALIFNSLVGPEKCGAHDACRHLLSQGSQREGMVEQLVRTRLVPDSFIHGARSAVQVAKVTGEAVAAWQDHRTLATRPYLIAGKGGQILATAIDPKYLFEGTIDASEAYKDGIPYLSPDDLSPMYREFFSIMFKQEVINRDNADLYNSQNARRIFLDQDSVGIGVNYPDTLGMKGGRGRTFKISLLDQKSVGFNRAVKLSASQLEYPMSHFSQAKDLIVKSDGRSPQLIVEALSRVSPVVAGWMKRPETRVIGASVDIGRLKASYIK